MSEVATKPAAGGPIRVLSGIQPTGNLHIGNYIGAVTQWVAMQQPDSENFYCIVDLHAITVPQDPKELRKKTREVAAILLAAGIDPKRSVLFVQSQVLAHTELAWILSCVTPYGWLARMTQFKDKSQKQREDTSAGLLTYPVLMAADILLYQASQVPVGEDQKQHLELTRDIAMRFNRMFGETFRIPEPRILDVGARIMGLDDPVKKMSKSEENPSHAVNLMDPPDVIRRKFQRATTDSLATIAFTEEQAGVFNLLTIYQSFTGQSREAIEAQFAGRGYGDLKKAVAEAVIEGLKPLQERYAVFAKDPGQLDALLKEGAAKASAVANRTIATVWERVGLGIGGG
ncbi:MAG: tryptophan--tRNA ligase [Dehalococcoidia bacterium]|nr:tryptophan--tRNA ligase [Dehalococcoidia bacterium]